MDSLLTNRSALVFGTLLFAQSAFTASADFDETVVVASRQDQPLWRVAAQVTTYDRLELDWLQARGIGDITRYDPALEVDHAGSRFGTSGISVRGIGGNRVVLELDGVPLPQHFSVGEFASTSRNALDTAAIGRIEVLRGPASSIYGSDAIGGVVAVTSADPVALVRRDRAGYLGGEAAYDSANNSTHGYLTTAWVGDTQAALLSFARHTGSETKSAFPGALTDPADFDQSRVFGKWQKDVTDSVRLVTIADWYESSRYTNLESPLGIGRQYARTIELLGNDRAERRRFSMDLAFSDPLGLDLLAFQAYLQSNETEQRTRDIRNAAEGLPPDQQFDRTFGFRETNAGVEARSIKTIQTQRTSQTLLAGIELEQTRLLEFRDGLGTNLLTGATSKFLPPGELLPRRDLPKSTVTSAAAYYQHEVTLGQTTLVPSIRWDHFELDASLDDLIADPGRLTSLEESDISLRLGATRRLGDNASAYLQYSQGFRAPPAEDVNLYLDYQGRVNVRALPNPDLSSERSQNLETGVRFAHGETSLEIAAYHSKYSDLIETRVRIGVDPVDGSLLFQSRNLQRASITGFEVSWSQGLGSLYAPLNPLTFSLGIHAARGENTITGESLNFLEPPKAVAGVLWNAGNGMSLGIYSTSVRRQQHVDLSSGTFFVPPSRTTLDLLGRWVVTPDLSLNLTVSNLGDKLYWRYGKVRAFSPGDRRIETLAEPGRTFSLTLHYSI